MSSTTGNRLDRDLYETPQWCIDALAESIVRRQLYSRLAPNRFGSVIDLGAGDGRIGRTVAGVLRKHYPTEHWPDLILNDINEPERRLSGERWLIRDFMDLNLSDLIWAPRTPVLVVSNPPFSLDDDFVIKTVSTTYQDKLRSHVAIFLLRLNWVGSEAREPWIKANAPTWETVLAPRPSFICKETVDKDGKVKKSSSDSCEYAWIWWENGQPPTMEVAVWPLDKAGRKAWNKKHRRTVRVYEDEGEGTP